MDFPKIPGGASMSYHMCMSIDTALDMALYRGRFKCEQDENGIGLTDTGYDIKAILGLPSEMTQTQIVNELERMKKDGYTAIPGDGCDSHEGGHCKGHVNRGITAPQVHGLAHR